jgi:hypothetical protein
VTPQRGGLGQQHPRPQPAVHHRLSPTSTYARPSSTPAGASNTSGLSPARAATATAADGRALNVERATPPVQPAGGPPATVGRNPKDSCRGDSNLTVHLCIPLAVTLCRPAHVTFGFGSEPPGGSRTIPGRDCGTS